MLCVLLAAVAATCTAHPAALDREVGQRSLPWLPPDLARQIVHREREFRSGAAAASRWDRTFHTPGGRHGLEATIKAQCNRLVAAIRGRAPFSEVVGGLGALAHLAVDLDAPFVGADQNDPYARSFVTYVSTAAPRIPDVFYGLPPGTVTGPVDGLQPYLKARRGDVGALASLIREDLDRIGGPSAWRGLDDRSSSFGAASLALNHASTDFAVLASWVWSHAGGLVPDIPMQRDMILVWKGEPKPREAPLPVVGFR